MGRLILSTLSELIRDELKDPRLPSLSLTEARVARDLTSAVLKVSTLGDAQATENCCALLNGAAPLLWNRLRDELRLRVVPKLRFEPDLSGLYVEEISRLLDAIPRPAEDAAAPATGVPVCDEEALR